MNSCFELADEIKKLDPQDPEWRDKVACMTKRLIHAEKLSVYHRLFLYLKSGPRNGRQFRKYARNYFTSRVLLPKIETHKDFSSRDYRRQIYGLFDWSK